MPKCINTILLVNMINSNNNNNNYYWNDGYLMYETVDKKVINQLNTMFMVGATY